MPLECVGVQTRRGAVGADSGQLGTTRQVSNDRYGWIIAKVSDALTLIERGARRAGCQDRPGGLARRGPPIRFETDGKDRPF